MWGHTLQFARGEGAELVPLLSVDEATQRLMKPFTLAVIGEDDGL